METINSMPCLTMKKNPFSKLVKLPLLTGWGAVCLLLGLIFCSGGSAAAAPEAPQGQNLNADSGQQKPTAALNQPNQAAAPAPQAQATEDLDATEPEDNEVTTALGDLLQSMKLGNFEYQVEERPDPFMPFISEKIIQSSEGEADNGGKLTGMRQLEPGQLTLAAILFTEVNPMAMVEDSSHRGYVIRRGTRIGKFGIVTDILPNAVIIKQLSYSMSQEKKYTTVEMILRKEGER